MDTVYVADGIYTDLGNYNIFIENGDRNLVLMSQHGPANCILDCQNNGFGFRIVVSGGSFRLSGFTIQNCVNDFGGAIELSPAAPDGATVIDHCIFYNNSAIDGGALMVSMGYPEVYHCIFKDNHASNLGNAYHTGPWSAIYFYNTIFFDTGIDGSEWFSHQYYCLYAYEIEDPPFYWHDYIISDPLLVDPENGDYSLQLESPCINAGDPELPFDPDLTRSDIGALSYNLDLVGDVNFDGNVDIIDIVLCVQIVLGEVTPFNAQFWAANYIQDLLIDVLDIVAIISYLII